MTNLAIAMIVSGVVLCTLWTIKLLTNSYPDWIDGNDFVLGFMGLGFVPVMGLVVAGGIALGGWFPFWKAFFWLGGPMAALYYILCAIAWKSDPEPMVPGLFAIMGIVSLLGAAFPSLRYVADGIGEWFRWLLGYH